MSDSPYDPSPETLARLRDRPAAEAAAKRLADDPELRGAVEKLKDIEQKLEAALQDASTAPASTGATYVADAKPEPVKGKLTVPRVVVQPPPKWSGHTTVRGLSLTPLVKLGLADVDNDGQGDVKATYRWGKIALIAAPFVLLGAYGVARAVGGAARVQSPVESPAAPAPPPAEPREPVHEPSERPPATSDLSEKSGSPEMNDRSPTKLSATGRAQPTAEARPDATAVPRPRPTATPSTSGWVPEF